MATAAINVTEAAMASQPNMGGAQFASHAWVEPIVGGRASLRVETGFLTL